MNLIKECIFGIVLFCVSNIAMADALASSILSCTKQIDDAQRLHCYDEVSQSLKTTKDALVPSAAVAQQPTIAPPAQIQSRQQTALVDGFGLSARPDPKDEVEKISAHVTNIDQDPFKKLVVSLDLGQVWQQTDGTRMYLREGDSVFLTKGALGSFFLAVEGKNKRMRVKRIK